SRRNKAMARAAADSSRREGCAAGDGLGTTVMPAPGKRARRRSRSCSAVSMARRSGLVRANDGRGRLPHSGILGGLEVVGAELRDGAIAVDVGAQMAWGVRAGNGLPAD